MVGLFLNFSYTYHQLDFPDNVSPGIPEDLPPEVPANITNGAPINIPGFSIKDKLPPDASTRYRFKNNLYLGIYNNVSVDLDVRLNDTLQNRDINIIIQNNKSFLLDIQLEQDIRNFGYNLDPKNPYIENYNLSNNYNSILKLKTDKLVKKLTFLFKLNKNFGLEPEKNYTINYYESSKESWKIIPTEIINITKLGLNIATSQDDNDNNYTSELYLKGEFENLLADTNYFFTVFQINKKETPEESWYLRYGGFLLIIITIAIVAITLILSKREYLSKVRLRSVFIKKGSHRLTLEEVLENKNRDRIIDIILNEPGIHFSELQRRIELSAGNLVWHLDILETYKIIGKKRIGNFVAYFPYYFKNPISNLDIKLRKSEVSLQILNLIEKNPGLWNNKISKMINLDHSTIKYHIDKLLELELIWVKKEGRKNKIYPNLDSEYFNSI